MAIREGRWDCPSCGSKRIFGRHVECPGCGKPRPAGIRFYLTDDAPAITDAAQLAEARAGADWVCQHCGASNRATVADCGGCGAPRGSSPGQRVVDYPTAQVPRSGDVPRRAGPLNAAKLSTLPAWMGRPNKEAAAGDGKPPGKAKTCLGCGCLGLVVMTALSLLLSLVQTCTGTRPVGGEDLRAATVTGKRWERSFLVEQRRVANGTGWDLPDSAEVVRTERRRRGWGQEVARYENVVRPARRTREVQDGTVTRTRQVQDGTQTRTRQVSERVRTGTRTYVCGQRDLGNGYFEDVECSEPEYETVTRTEEYEVPDYRTEEYEEPTYRTEEYYVNETVRVPVYRRVAVYDTFFTYRAATWDSVEVRTAKGDTTAPAWPDTTVGPNQRISRRRQAYWMSFRRAGGTPLGTQVDLSVFSGWRVGQRVSLRLDEQSSRALAVLPADSLSACRRWHLGRDRDNPPGDSLGCSPPPPD